MPEKDIDVIKSYELSVKFLFKNPTLFIIALIPLTASLAMALTMGSIFTGVLQTISSDLASGNLMALLMIIPPIIGSITTFALVSMIVYPLTSGAYTLSAQQLLTNKKFKVSEALKNFFLKILKIIITSFISGLLISVGFMLLIIPGIILLLFLAYIVPAAVIEDKGIFETIGHAINAGKKNVGNTILFFLIALLINIPLMFLGPIISSIVSSLILTPIVSIAFGITYLRVLKK